jgi:hypothetical protein
LDATLVETLQTWELILGHSYDELAALVIGHVVLVTELVGARHALYTQLGPLRSRRVVDTGVDHTTVVTALVLRWRKQKQAKKTETREMRARDSRKGGENVSNTSQFRYKNRRAKTRIKKECACFAGTRLKKNQSWRGRCRVVMRCDLAQRWRCTLLMHKEARPTQRHGDRETLWRARGKANEREFESSRVRESSRER